MFAEFATRLVWHSLTSWNAVRWQRLVPLDSLRFVIMWLFGLCDMVWLLGRKRSGKGWGFEVSFSWKRRCYLSEIDCVCGCFQSSVCFSSNSSSLRAFWFVDLMFGCNYINIWKMCLIIDLFLLNLLTFNIIFTGVKCCLSIKWSIASSIHLNLIWIGHISSTTSKTLDLFLDGSYRTVLEVGTRLSVFTLGSLTLL